MSNSIIQRSFAGGEIAPALYGRADQTKYQTGLKTCRNFWVMRHGGVQNRTGSELMAEVKTSSLATYFMKFVFNDAQTYVLEIGNLYMRFYREAARIAVSSVTAWSNVTVYVPGDLASRLGINYYCILGHSAQQPPNATYWYPLTGSIYEIPTPYLTADLSTLNIVQSGDVVTITHPSYDPRELSRTGHTAWTLTPISFLPSLSAPASPGATAGVAGAIVWSYKVTAVQALTYEESLPTAAFTCAGADPTAAAPNLLTWTAVTGAVEYWVYRETFPGSAIWGYIGSCGDVTYPDPKNTPNESEAPPVARNPFSGAGNRPSTATYYQQRLVFANSDNDPEGVNASRIGNFHNHTISSPSQDDDAVSFTIAGRRVNEVRHLVDLNTLVILTSGGEWTAEGDADGVLLPTAINLRQQGYNGAAAVPPVIVGNSLLYLQARGGILRDLRYSLEADGYSGRDLSIFSPHLFDGYTITRMDYAEIPQSIVWLVRSDGKLLGLTYLREHEVWGWHRHDTDGLYEDVCVVPEGELDACYVIVKRTINGSTKRYVERFASRRVTDVRIDALFLDSFLSYDGRNAGGTTMTPGSSTGWTVDDEITVTASVSTFVAGDVGNAIAFLDADGGELVRIVIATYVSGTVVRGYPNKTVPVASRSVATTVWARAVDAVSGLAHLEAKTVSILADGNVLAQEVVASGAITLDRPYSVIHVGLPIEADFETLDLDIAGSEIRSRKKKITGLSVLVESSRGIFAGPDADNLTELEPESIDHYGDPIGLVTGLVELPIPATWDSNGRIFIRQNDPLPLSILSVIPTGDIGG